MNHKYALIILSFYSLVFSMDKDLIERKVNERLQYYNSLMNGGKPYDIARYIGNHNAKLAFEGTLKDDEFLIETHTFLRFIEKHAQKIDAFDIMKEFLSTAHTRKKDSLRDNVKNPLFLNNNTLTTAFSLFHNYMLLTKKNEMLSLLKIEDPLLLNSLIYKDDALKYVYSIPRKHSPTKSDIVKKGLKVGVDTSIKIFNVFRKKDNPINSNSETLINNSPLLPDILNTLRGSELIFDNTLVLYPCVDKEEDKKTEIKFLKIMFQPNHFQELTQYKVLPNDAQKRIFTILCCWKHSKKDKNSFPKPIQHIIIKNLISKEKALEIRDYLLTEVTLLNLNYLDEKEDFSDSIKDAMQFVKNDLLVWFDNEVSKL